jgi:hypothetical protein
MPEKETPEEKETKEQEGRIRRIVREAIQEDREEQAKKPVPKKKGFFDL